MHADVDVKSFDLEFAKTIPLGGGGGCECGDPCGCGDACGSGCGCPAWDVTWSGGFRFADVDWNRTYTAVDDDEFVTTEAVSTMDFRGGGLRVGLGRSPLLLRQWLHERVLQGRYLAALGRCTI